jgi:hypothetical protein
MGLRCASPTAPFYEMDEMRSSNTQWSADGDLDRTHKPGTNDGGLVPAILNIERFGFEGSQTL